jgi:DNA polymerase-3 subunit delta'
VRDIPSFVYRKSYEGGYKAVIAAGAQDMTEQAQNALLKVLEEPPARTVFLLLTQNAKSLLPTILSRCIILDARSDTPDAEGRIAEEFSVSTAAARVMLRAAGGDYYKARIYAENGYTEMRNDMILALGRLFYAKNMAVSVTEKLILKYEGLLALAMDVALIYLKDVLGYKHTGDEGAVVNIDRIEEIKKHAMLRDRTLAGTAGLLAGFTAKSRQCPGANKKLMLTGTLFDILEVTI